MDMINNPLVLSALHLCTMKKTTKTTLISSVRISTDATTLY